MSAHNLEGALNKLRTTTEKLNNVAGFISSIIDAVLGFDPSPFRVDVIPAVLGVQGAPQDIVDRINVVPPDDQIPVEFTDALEDVLGSAESLVDDTVQYIQELEEGDCTIAPDIDESACIERVECNWIVDAQEPYCCFTLP